MENNKLDGNTGTSTITQDGKVEKLCESTMEWTSTFWKSLNELEEFLKLEGAAYKRENTFLFTSRKDGVVHVFREVVD